MKNSIAMHVGLHQAKAQIMYMKSGDEPSANRAYSRLCQTIENADSPDLALIMISRRLGRSACAQIPIQPEVVDLAINHYVVTPEGEVFHPCS